MSAGPKFEDAFPARGSLLRIGVGVFVGFLIGGAA